MSSSDPILVDFPPELIALHSNVTTKAQAIDAVAGLLTDAGAIDPAYAASMHAREAQANTYLGQAVAIPHGQPQQRHLVLQDRVAVLQIPHGVDWGEGNVVKLVFGIAAKGEGHLDVLRRLTRLLQDQARIAALCTTNDWQDIARVLSDDNPLTSQSTTSPTVNPARDLAEQQSWVLDYPGGLHARPATGWLQAARADNAGEAHDTRLQVRNTRNGLSSRFASLVELLHIDARCGDTLVFSAEGAQARQRLQYLLTQVKVLSQQEQTTADAASGALPASQPLEAWQPPESKNALRGVPASSGLSVGTVLHIHSGEVEIPDTPEPLAQAGQRLQTAINAAQAQLTALIDDMTRRVGASDVAIFRTHIELLHDEVLIAATSKYLLQGHGLAWSWQRATIETSARMQAQNNPKLASRAADIRDVGLRVLAHIDPALVVDGMVNALTRLPADVQNIVIVADDLSPSDTASLDTSRVCALVTALGGPYAHTAILARTLGLPAIVAVGDVLEQAKDGQQVIVDGTSGTLWLQPSAQDIQAAKEHISTN